MSHHDHHAEASQPHRDPDPADSKVDAIAAVFAVLIAVAGALYYISHHGV